MTDTVLDDFEKRLKELQDKTSLMLSPALLVEIGLATIPNWALPSMGLELLNVSINRLDEISLLINGSFEHPIFLTSEWEIDIATRNGLLEATINVGVATPKNIQEFLQTAGFEVGGEVGDVLKQISVDSLNIARPLAAPELSIGLVGEWRFAVLGLDAVIVMERALLDFDPTASLYIKGQLRVGGLELGIELRTNGDLKFEVNPTGITLESLTKVFGIAIPPLPPLPLLTQEIANLSIEIYEGKYCFGGAFPWGDSGLATLSLINKNGIYALVVLLKGNVNFKFSTLNNALAPLDVVNDLVEFGSPAVIVSTASGELLPVLDFSGNWGPLTVDEGVTLQGKMKLIGFGLDTIGDLLHQTELPFVVPILPDFSNLKIRLGLDREVAVLPGVLTISNFRIELMPEPLAVAVEGEASLDIFGQKLPRLILGAALTPPLFSLNLRAAEPWKQVGGLPADIVELGLQISGPVFSYGVFGKIELSGRSLTVATSFTAGAPTFLAAELKGDMSLPALLKDFTGLELPLDFGPKVQDASIYIVVDPLGVNIAGRIYPPGLGLSGTLFFLGLAATLYLSANSTKVVARGSLSNSIQIATILKITGSGDEPTPYFAIDSATDPIATVNGRVEFFGLTEDIRGVIGSDSISFLLKSKVGLVQTELNAVLGEGHFRSKGISSCKLQAQLGPLRLYDGGPSLGTVTLDTGIDAQTDIDVKENGEFRFFVEGKIEVAGLMIEIPLIELQKASFEEIPQELVNYLQQQVNVLFKALVSDVEKWLRAYADKVIADVDNVARVVIEEFKKDVQFAATALINTLNFGIDEATKQLHEVGIVAEQIASSFSALNRAPNEIRSALEGLGIPPDVVSAALAAAFPTIPHVDMAPIPHADIAAIPHLDAGAVHTDTAGVHTDITGPHQDIGTPHIDGVTGHTDDAGGGFIHTDFGGIHTDIGTGHTDVAGIHTDDTTAHVDVILTPHVDIPEAAHIDVPAVGHIDTP